MQACVRWYLAYGLSLRDLEEMMVERGIRVDHSTVHRWVLRFSPWLLKNFNLRRRAVTRKWHVDETIVPTEVVQLTALVAVLSGRAGMISAPLPAG